MQNIIIFTAVLACAAAAPGYLLSDADVYHTVPLSAKSTLTQSSQVIDHGSTFVHTPVVPLVHATPVHIPSGKTTITKSNQIVNHGGLAVVHTPVHYMSYDHDHTYYHVPSKSTLTHSNQIVDHGATHYIHHAVPVVHSSPVYLHSSPLVTVKTGDSAVSHHSSTVHETVPVVKSVPVYAIHH